MYVLFTALFYNIVIDNPFLVAGTVHPTKSQETV
jgi:hypothetical protein